MFEIADRLLDLVGAGRRVAVATVVAATGSSPSAVGTSMAVDDTGAVTGSIAGGCVEGAVYELCRPVLAGGAPAGERFGITDDEAFAVGLTCGGVLRVHARLLTADDVVALRRAAAGQEAVVVVPLAGGPSASVAGRLGAAVDARRVRGRSGLVRLDGPDGPLEAFVEVAVPPARLVLYGALELSAALALAARAVGFRVTVCDPRPLFATPQRLPGADDVVVDWPPRHLGMLRLTSRDAVAVLSHDDRYDAELVLAALRSGAGYVGALGSRRTHHRRVGELRALGARADELDRLRSPVGLDLGAATPAETAVSVLAEILAVRTGATARPLAELEGPIHRPRSAETAEVR
jgi:xanthine dehydrogenase accessory factor